MPERPWYLSDKSLTLEEVEKLVQQERTLLQGTKKLLDLLHQIDEANEDPLKNVAEGEQPEKS